MTISHLINRSTIRSLICTGMSGPRVDNMGLYQLFPLHWAGWVVATLPMHSIVEAKTDVERDAITEKWKEATLSTLTSVIYIVRLPLPFKKHKKFTHWRQNQRLSLSI